jgi:hypothetical protein
MRWLGDAKPEQGGGQQRPAAPCQIAYIVNTFSIPYPSRQDRDSSHGKISEHHKSSPLHTMAINTWLSFIRQCLVQRTAGNEFQELAVLLKERSPTSGAAILRSLLDCRDGVCVTGDPLILVYLQAIIISTLASPSDLIATMIRRWNKSTEATRLTSVDDTALINSLAELIASAKMFMPPREARKCLALTARWLTSVAGWASQDTNALHEGKLMSLTEGVGILLATIMSTEEGGAALTKTDEAVSPTSLEPRSSVRDALNCCLPLFSTFSPPLFHRLDAFQKNFDLFDDSFANRGTSSKMDLNVIAFESNILDIEVMCSRGALLAFIDAKVLSPLFT